MVAERAKQGSEASVIGLGCDEISSGRRSTVGVERSTERNEL